MKTEIETIIITRNPQTAMKAMRNHAFMCIAPINHKSNLVFNQTMFAVDSAGASVSKLAKFARQHGLNDSTHTIYQVCPNGVVWEYSIDKN